MRGAGPDCGLIARERSREQRTGIEAAALERVVNMNRGLAGAALTQTVAQVQQAGFECALWKGNRLARERRNPPRQLGGKVLGRERQPRKASALDSLAEIDDDGQQRALKIDGRAEIGPRPD